MCGFRAERGLSSSGVTQPAPPLSKGKLRPGEAEGSPMHSVGLNKSPSGAELPATMCSSPAKWGSSQSEGSPLGGGCEIFSFGTLDMLMEGHYAKRPRLEMLI